MCPTFDNEETKDISALPNADLEVETASLDYEDSPEIDITSSDDASEEFQNVSSSSEVESEDSQMLPDTKSVSDPKSENYLLYGRTDIPEGINFKETLSFLTEQLGYDGGELRQARQKKDGSGIIDPEENATENCSYCGLPISGVDYYKLPDGRKRCTNCNRSLVKSAEELNTILNEVLLNMELFFEASIDVPISIEMIEERKLKKKIRKGLGTPPKNVLILGLATEHKGKYTVYVENGIPRASLIATLAHELTHIWQYTHWNSKGIKKKYGSKMKLLVYEGMAMWTEIQYLYHIGEQTIAKREELNTLARNDEYGIGFTLYVDQYPLKRETKAFIETPFSAGETPLDTEL